MSTIWSHSAVHCTFINVVVARRGSTRAVNSGLSLRASGRGFPLATMKVAPGYFHIKIEEK